jgi:hypothetical protein
MSMGSTTHGQQPTKKIPLLEKTPLSSDYYMWSPEKTRDVCPLPVGLRSVHVDLLVPKKIAQQHQTENHENKG